MNIRWMNATTEKFQFTPDCHRWIPPNLIRCEHTNYMLCTHRSVRHYCDRLKRIRVLYKITNLILLRKWYKWKKKECRGVPTQAFKPDSIRFWHFLWFKMTKWCKQLSQMCFPPFKTDTPSRRSKSKSIENMWVIVMAMFEVEMSRNIDIRRMYQTKSRTLKTAKDCEKLFLHLSRK